MQELSKEKEEIIWRRVNKLKEKRPNIYIKGKKSIKRRDEKINCFYCNKLHNRISLYCSQSCASKQFWKKVKEESKELQPKIGDKRENSLGYMNLWDGNKWVIEHRYIFEKYLGRNLMEDEIIHHRNGNKSDNRLENLQLLTKKLHCPRIETRHSEDIFELLVKIKNLEQQLEHKQ